MDRARGTLLTDIGVGLLAGLVATRVTGFAQEALARPMPGGVKEHERRLRPEPTSRVAARKIARGLATDSTGGGSSWPPSRSTTAWAWPGGRSTPS